MAAILDLPVSLNSLPLQVADECVSGQVGITVQSGILCSNCVLDHRLGKNYSTEPVPSSLNCPTSIKIPLSAATSLLAAFKQNFASESFAAYSSSPAFAQTTASSESASSRPPAFSPPPLFYRPYCTYATAALLPKPLLPKTLPPPPPHSPPQFWMLAFRFFFSGYASVKISYRYPLVSVAAPHRIDQPHSMVPILCWSCPPRLSAPSLSSCPLRTFSLGVSSKKPHLLSNRPSSQRVHTLAASQRWSRHKLLTKLKLSVPYSWRRSSSISLPLQPHT
ncbi:uncharacterized protein IWZ02DRAFT_160973 [Phyllosticta citriasiana]|uniref:uncharacterized protein n=1 Tax=Phyllosticta citriasiana TaxID=595635 RepID=UPI0030FDE164